MKGKNEKYGFAIALAWPQTFCKEPGAWYDPVTRWLGINKNNYYQAGHAALVLIDSETEKCHYFDFGRYHSPYQHGRVRSAVTDHDLEMKTSPRISRDGKSIENFNEILEELQLNPACHGEGALHASYCEIDFHTAYNKVLQMQAESPIPYGPFIRNGSNCSRFVNTAILAGIPRWKYRMRLKYFVPFTPTPLNNVNSLQQKIVLPVILQKVPFFPVQRLSKTELESTLSQPVKHSDIPENAQWLSGEGAGSWFVVEFQNKQLKVTRYAPDGTIECLGLYKESNGHSFNPGDTYRVNYPSNCREVNLKNYGRKIQFERI